MSNHRTPHPHDGSADALKGPHGPAPFLPILETPEYDNELAPRRPTPEGASLVAGIIAAIVIMILIAIAPAVVIATWQALL